MAMKDVILEKFMEPERWQYAISKGIGKDMSRSVLYQLTKEEVRMSLAQRIASGTYEVAPPHIALIPKDEKGEFREVSVNEPLDRITTSISNDLLFESMPEMRHPSCKSYLKGTGCNDVVMKISGIVSRATAPVIGWKADLSKYFDSVPIKYIDEAFDKVEAKWGHSSVIDFLRKYYHCDLYFDVDKKLVSNYKSLKQGCAVASWLADVVLYHIDEKLSKLAKDKDSLYIRYSDDILFIGKNYRKAMTILSDELRKMGMKLNPKKVEYISPKVWFKFLGFSIKGGMRSMSKTRLKKFAKEIKDRTKHGTSYAKAVNSVNRYLYKGNGEFSWATSILKVVNVPSDLMEMDNFVKDCLRSCKTDHHKVGGLGYVKDKKDGVVVRGRGKHVRSNREKTPEMIDGYLTLLCMQKAILTSREFFNTLVRTL